MIGLSLTEVEARAMVVDEDAVTAGEELSLPDSAALATDWSDVAVLFPEAAAAAAAAILDRILELSSRSPLFEAAAAEAMLLSSGLSSSLIFVADEAAAEVDDEE